jgi:peroxisomal 2,4-dienoyl-CoA reductase
MPESPLDIQSRSRSLSHSHSHPQLGTYNTVKATLPSIRKTQGAYLHISATLHYKGTPYQAHVSAAKAAIDALSQVIAVEEGPRGVRSNVVAPG